MTLTVRERWKENITFLTKFMHRPKEIGSVTPSSRFLAQAMVNAVPWRDMQSIAELGAGTGAVTRAIHASKAAKRSAAQVLLFEIDSQLRGELRRQYPSFQCFPDVARLEEALAEAGIAELDCIVSGLPFFNFAPNLRDRLLQQIAVSLKPGGWFIAFQYSTQMRKHLAQHFHIRKIQFVLLNIPPAFVYVCQKKADHE
ncbi:methyltransferase domain-containing protein [Paenibacillaceae bacterium]|nr:methyltransferase domain-containing protein [Paenibacillaceae bacterium]